MKKLTLVLASVFAISAQSMAHGNGFANINSYADAFVFDEMGVTFSVYPDGEFDFYLPGNQQSTTVSNGFVNVTYNSGYNYNPYVQYDDFGAVIQVENVPVWYDYYGRVNQIGDVMISYRDQRVCRVGGLQVYYNGFGNYAYHTGFINTWNPYFVYRPFYACFARPVVNLCFVSASPYRQYYTPVRYTYYRPYWDNVRPCYATIGHTYRPNGYGQAHHRYTQSAGQGEVAVVRSRRTVTTADASPRPSTVNQSTVNRADATTQRFAGNATSVRSNNGTRQTSDVRQSSSNSNAGRVARPATEVRQPAATQPRTVQSAPARTNTNSRIAPSTSLSRPAATTQSRSNASSAAVSRPSTSAQTAPARSSVSSAASRSSVSNAPSNSRTSTTQTQQSSSSRSAVSKPAASSTSRVSSSQPSRSSSSVQAPTRSSVPSSSLSKGSVSKTSSSKRAN